MGLEDYFPWNEWQELSPLIVGIKRKGSEEFHLVITDGKNNVHYQLFYIKPLNYENFEKVTKKAIKERERLVKILRERCYKVKHRAGILGLDY